MSEFSGSPTAPSSSTANEPSIKDKATDSMQIATRASSDLTQTAADKAKDVAQETTRQARNFIGEAREQMHDQAGQQHQTLISNLRSIGDELGGMAGGNDQNGIAHDLVGQAGDHAHALAEWLDARQPGELVDELRTFARRRPGTFLIGAAMAGVLAGRLTRGVVASHTNDEPTPDAFAGSATQPAMTGGTGPDVASLPYATSQPGFGEASQ
jgi:hypothetical protein